MTSPSELLACIKCGEGKPESEFSRGTGRYGNGRRSTCKTCCSAYLRDYYENNRERVLDTCTRYYQNNKERRKETSRRWVEANQRRVKDAHLRRQFGITIEQYEQLLESQNGVCGICKCPPDKLRLAVDHDHATNEIRGLLCGNCNTAIGLLRESRELFEAAIAYLDA